MDWNVPINADTSPKCKKLHINNTPTRTKDRNWMVHNQTFRKTKAYFHEQEISLTSALLYFSTLPCSFRLPFLFSPIASENTNLAKYHSTAFLSSSSEKADFQNKVSSIFGQNNRKSKHSSKSNSIF